jgi:hypothetical protein
MCSQEYIQSDTKIIDEEQTTTKTPKLGKRGLEWHEKLRRAISIRVRVLRLKALEWTNEQICKVDPGYCYDEEYHGLTSSTGFRRNKSMGDLFCAVGTNQGYSGYEWCGERLTLSVCKEAPPQTSLDCIVL